MCVKLKALPLILSHLLIVIGLVDALQKCYDTGNFTTNSTYAKNRDLILASLQANVTANGNFFTTTIGQSPDKVYALGMCLTDAAPEACYKCLNSSIPGLKASCPYQKEALSFVHNPCLVHYADHSFYGTLELEPTDAGYNTGDITSNLTEFDRVWERLLDSVMRKASNGSSYLKYATGEADVSVFVKIYTQMQCTPDLSKEDCDSCLRQSASYYVRCCHGKQGGYVRKPNCNLRWDLYPFYTSNASTSATAPPPTPSPSPPPPAPSPPY